jgi:hypothetical protein
VKSNATRQAAGSNATADDATPASSNQVSPKAELPMSSSLSAATPQGNATAAAAAVAAPAGVPPPGAPPIVVNDNCPPYINTAAFKTTNFNDTLNTTVAVSPGRPNPDR